jgi:hypothetical protein
MAAIRVLGSCQKPRPRAARPVARVEKLEVSSLDGWVRLAIEPEADHRVREEVSHR